MCSSVLLRATRKHVAAGKLHMWPPERQERQPQEPRCVVLAAAVPLQHFRQPREQHQQQPRPVWHQPVAVADRLPPLGRGCQGQVCAHAPMCLRGGFMFSGGQPGTTAPIAHVPSPAWCAKPSLLLRCAVVTQQHVSGCTRLGSWRQRPIRHAGHQPTKLARPPGGPMCAAGHAAQVP